MRVRRLDPDNDMTFGSGGLNFYEDAAEGVAQNVYTRLKLFLGEWFLNEDEGTDWMDKCLCKNTLDSALAEVRRVIALTSDVVSIDSLDIKIDPDTRNATIYGSITTEYGKTTFNYNGSFFIGEKHGTY